MEKTYCVYKHTNKINNKVYIGQTCRKKAFYRWGINGKGYEGSPYFYQAIEKYGWDNFQHEILYDNLSKEEANKLEKQLIQLYDSTNHKNGYNLTYGGQNCIIYKLRSVICIQTNQIYKSLADAALSCQTSDSHIFEAANGIRLTAGGYHWIFPEEDSPQNRQNKLNKKRQYTNGTNQPVKIKCNQTNMIFNSMSDAAQWCGLKTITGISLCLKGKQKTAGKHPVTKQALTWERI